MLGDRRQHRRRQAVIILTMLACLDEGKRLCGEVDANISTGRPPLFAPLSPLALMPSFRGAKSSHFRRRISTSRASGDALSLLPATRKPLQLRSGEQNLHISAAEFELPGHPAAAPLCSPLPAIPCAFVSGSKIFTFPPPDLSLPSARWRRLWLVGSFGGARKSKKRCTEGLIGLPCIAFSILFFCNILDAAVFSVH